MGESQANHNGQCETQEVDSVVHTHKDKHGDMFISWSSCESQKPLNF